MGEWRYKEDWDEAQGRLEAWWRGEVMDRVVLQVYAPRESPLPVASPPPPPDDFPTCTLNWLLSGVWAYWGATDASRAEWLLAHHRHHWARTFFGGEAYPHLWLNFGPGVLSAYLTGQWQFVTDTVWFAVSQPLDWEAIERLTVEPSNPWWQGTLNWARALGAHAAGEFILGTTDIGGILDVLASLRHTERLLTDLYDAPEAVEAACLHIAQAWHRVYETLYREISRFQQGSSAWMAIWSPLRWYPIQCDFSYMISPEFFERFVMPTLQYHTERLDHVIYHWDGPGQIPHLDALLRLPNLHGIQWVPGAGNPPVDEEVWFPLYRRIQAEGKNLVLHGVRPQRLEQVLEALQPEGLLCSVWCRSETEARELLQQAKRWTHQRRIS